MKFPKNRAGQSLVEILVAMILGVLLLLAAIAALVPALNISGQTATAYTGALLASETLDTARTWAEGDWRKLLALSTSSYAHYYLNTSSSPFLAVAGEETIVMSNIAYARYFFVEDVFRDAGGFIIDEGALGAWPDPSTKKIVAVWQAEGSPSSTISQYITRYRNAVTVFTDWAGGPGQAGPITKANNRFDSATEVEYNQGGSISYSTAPGILDSSTMDTGVASGTQLNAILWNGSQPGGAAATFQFASSDSASGPWSSSDFIGPDGTNSTEYTATVGVMLPLDPRWHQGRYFRYRVKLNGSETPVVQEVIASWSP